MDQKTQGFAQIWHLAPCEVFCAFFAQQSRLKLSASCESVAALSRKLPIADQGQPSSFGRMQLQTQLPPLPNFHHLHLLAVLLAAS